HHDALLRQYVDYLIREIRLLRDFCQQAPKIEQITIDGGMQMLLDRHQFERLVQTLEQNFRLDQKTVFSATLNPRFSRNTLISIYQEIGINEIAIDARNLNTHDLLHPDDEHTAIRHEIMTLNAIHAAQR